MPTELSAPAKALCLTIARCPEAMRLLRNPDATSPCLPIVDSQRAKGAIDFQLPEPWTGHIEQASILFLSSNPSIRIVRAEEAASGAAPPEPIVAREASDDEIVSHSDGAFENWIKDGTHPVSTDGEVASATMFWSHARNRASELLERSPVPGVDYALTEVVHCKSAAEDGVASAWSACANRYLDDVLAVSAAKIVVVYGDPARREIESRFKTIAGPLSQPIDISGRQVRFAFLPHPNSRGKEKRNCAPLSQAQLDDARAWLR